MDIGCHLPNQGPLATGEALVRFCREAERRDVASLWVSDHVIFPRSATGSRSPCSRQPRCAPAARGSARRCSSSGIAIRW
jgi:hypothetical protein